MAFMVTENNCLKKTLFKFAFLFLFCVCICYLIALIKGHVYHFWLALRESASVQIIKILNSSLRLTGFSPKRIN